MLRADLVIQKKPEERGEPSMRVEEDITRILHARHLCRKWDEMVLRRGTAKVKFDGRLLPFYAGFFAATRRHA